jgi:hypothetical protein
MTPAHRALIMAAGKAAVAWALDTDECHFCHLRPSRKAGRWLHTDGCPLEPLNTMTDQQALYEECGE